jgi:hypothetical protein
LPDLFFKILDRFITLSMITTESGVVAQIDAA